MSGTLTAMVLVAAGSLPAGCSDDDSDTSEPQRTTTSEAADVEVVGPPPTPAVVVGSEVDLNWMVTDTVTAEAVCEQGGEIAGDPAIAEGPDIVQHDSAYWSKAVLLTSTDRRADAVVFASPDPDSGHVEGSASIEGGLVPSPQDENELAARLRVGGVASCFAMADTAIAGGVLEVTLVPTELTETTTDDPAWQTVPLY